MHWIIKNKETREVLCKEVKKADNFLLRFVGFMGKKTIGADEGLLLEKVSSIHTCFMRFVIDVVYLDREYKVIYKETVIPWRIGKIVKKTAHVLEMPRGAGKKFEIGTQIEISNR